MPRAFRVHYICFDKTCNMKPYLLFIISAVFLFTGCNNYDDSASTKMPNDNDPITTSVLPKGHSVIDDEVIKKTIDANTGALGGYDNKTNPQAGESVADPNADLKRRYKNLLVFHADDTMKVRKAYIATLILGKDQILGTMKDEALESSNAGDEKFKHDTSVEIGSKMRARLIDMSGAVNKGFDIELIGGEDAATQSITEKRKKAVWNWKLTPQTPGQQELKLAITVIEKDGEAVTLPTKNIPVMIFAEKETFLESAGNFFNDNAKWILTAILLPIFIAWVTSKMKYRPDYKHIDVAKEKNKESQPHGSDHSISPTVKPPPSYDE
jgi:hypothetical protein